MIPSEKHPVASPHLRSNTSTENFDDVGAHVRQPLL